MPPCERLGSDSTLTSAMLVLPTLNGRRSSCTDFAMDYGREYDVVLWCRVVCFEDGMPVIPDSRSAASRIFPWASSSMKSFDHFLVFPVCIVQVPYHLQSICPSVSRRPPINILSYCTVNPFGIGRCRSSALRLIKQGTGTPSRVTTICDDTGVGATELWSAFRPNLETSALTLRRLPSGHHPHPLR